MSERRCSNPKCGKLLARRPNETAQNFERRESCDKLCGAQVIRLRRLGVMPPRIARKASSYAENMAKKAQQDREREQARDADPIQRFLCDYRSGGGYADEAG